MKNKSSNKIDMMLLNKFNEVDSRIDEINTRNKKVEGDKAWETSKIRIASIVVLIYIVTALTMEFLHFNQPFAAAFIPSLGYFLSTLTLGVIRRRFVGKLDNNEKK